MADQNDPFALSEAEQQTYASLRQGNNPWDGAEKVAEPDDFNAAAEDDPETAADMIEADSEAETEAEKPAEPAKKRFENVPFKVFEAQKKAAQEAKRELQAKSEQFAREQATWQERMAVINAMMGKQEAGQPEEDVPPDPTVDVFAHAKWQERQIEQLKAQTEQQKAAQAQQAQIAQLRSAFQQAEAEFKANAPDYDDATAFLIEGRKKEMQALGYKPEQIGPTIVAEIDQMAANAFRQGRNPAELAYQIAQARGWAPKAAAEKAPEPAAKKLETVAKGQQAAKTLSGTSGSATKAELTVESLISMSPSEFDKFVDRNLKSKNKLLRSIVGN